MTIYFYAYSDNRKGLERVRRSATLAKELQKEFEVYFMTTEFRSATYAKRVLGVKKTVGIEDFRNSANIAPRGSVFIYDSHEHNEIIHQEMIDFFGAFFRISYDPDDKPKKGEYLISPFGRGENVIEGILVDSYFFQDRKKEIEKLFFYGDSDYERQVEKLAPKLKELELELLEGFYFFANVEDKVTPFFKAIHPSEDYLETIASSRLLLTSSLQSSLEGIASGAKVVYVGEKSKLLDEIGVKTLNSFEPSKIQEVFSSDLGTNPSLLIAKNVQKTADIIKEVINKEGLAYR